MGQGLIMARPILPDTDVLVDFLRGHSKAVAFVNTCHAHVILSPIVIAELYAGVKGDAEYAALQDFISLFRVVPVSAAPRPPASTSETSASPMALVWPMPS